MTRSLIALSIGTLLGLGAGALTHAATGGGLPWSSSGTLIAQADPPPPPKRAPLVPPAPPAPPVSKSGGVSVTIKDGKVTVEGVRELVERQVADAKNKIANDPSIPKDVRDKVTTRMEKARAIVDKRLANLKVSDINDLESELEKMGEELEHEMEGLGQEMEKLGEALGKKHGISIDLDFDDDDHDVPMAPDVDVDRDDDDLRDAINDLKDLAVKPAQRDAITKLRTDSDKTVADARKRVDELSTKLHTALGNAGTSDTEISTLVDQISAQEAVIRKARIVAWNQARRVLDESQRKKVDAATPKKTK